MKFSRLAILTFCSISLLICLTTNTLSIETEAVEKEGVKAIQMGTGHDSIQAGESLEIGLLIQHLPKFHTYWKAPGIVGLPTSIEWTLPEGFTVSELEWPVPEVTKMAKYTCYGYERDICLISKLQAPEKIDSESIKIKASVSYMCCADVCHPSHQDFELIIPVTKEVPKPDKKWQSVFELNRNRKPLPTPENWAIKAAVSGDTIFLDINCKDAQFPPFKGAQFFCETNTVHSDRPQVTSLSEDKQTATLKLPLSEFAPEKQTQFTGLLFNPNGWPEIDSHWIQINTPLTIREAQSN